MEVKQPTPEELDLEYVQVLRLIKPHIYTIVNPRYISLIKAWLEKLSGLGTTDKMLRNLYLIRLSHQIQDGNLHEPFLNEPPAGELRPLICNEFPMDDVSSSKCKSKSKTLRRRHQKRSRTYYMNDQAYIKHHRRKSESIPAEDSSWLDLSEPTHEHLDCGDAAPTQEIYDNNVKNLIDTIESLRVENTVLHEVIEKFAEEMQKCGNHTVNELDCMREEIYNVLHSHNYANEWQYAIDNLQRKLATMERKNVELRNIANNLENKLVEAQRINNGAPQKCMLLAEMHRKEIDSLKLRHKKEMLDLQNDYNEQMKQFKEKFDTARCWYEKRNHELRANALLMEQQLNDATLMRQNVVKASSNNNNNTNEDDQLIKMYEKRMGDIKSEYEAQVREKTDEILRLETLLQEQCQRMQEEVGKIRAQIDANTDEEAMKTIDYLQKCILKMDRLFKKAEKDYERQLARLRRECDMREKQAQIKLTAERVRLISSSSGLRQKDVDDIINKLEQQYKGKLIEQQNLALAEKKNDLRIIYDLRQQLAERAN